MKEGEQLMPQMLGLTRLGNPTVISRGMVKW